MNRAMRLAMVFAFVAGGLALSGTQASAGAQPTAYTCNGGEIPSGNYKIIVVKGECQVAPDAVINVLGNIEVAAGAVFDAQSAPSTITVGKNVTGLRGSLVGLGCQPPSYTGNSAHECVLDPEGISTITVNGNVTVANAAAVLLNGITVHGNVRLTGGGSEIPWSIKNNTIDGNVRIKDQNTEWLGVLFNTIGKTLTLTDIALSDPHPGAPGVYIVVNTVGGNLNCTGLTPGVSGGFNPNSVNIVGRKAKGQCADLV